MSIITPNMSLVRWDSLSDNYSHTELASNFQAIDDHDHTAGKGKLIPAGGLASLAVTSANLQDGIFTSSKIADGSVTTAKIADLAVTSGKFDDGVISTAKLADDAVTSPKIAADAVGSSEIAASAVGTTELASAAVSRDKLDASTVADIAGVSTTSVVRRGKSIIDTEESRTNTAYGTLTTPDQVSNVVLPTDGLIALAFFARFKSSVNGAGSASLFLEGNRVIIGNSGVPNEAFTNMTDTYFGLHSYAAGLARGTGVGSLVTTGASVGGELVNLDLTDGDNIGSGGICYIFATAGTYTVSVRFKATSGSVTARERKLWVWTTGF